MIVGSSRATITLPMGTQLEIEDALLYPDSTRTLLSFKDMRKNGFHTETHSFNNEDPSHNKRQRTWQINY